MKAEVIARGRRLVIAIICVFAGLEIATLLVYILSGMPIQINWIRYVLTIVLCVFMYKGYDWAKLLLALGAMIGVFMSIYTLYIAVTRSFDLFAVPFVLGDIAVFGSITAALLLSSSISEFMKDQEERRLAAARGRSN